uniref:Uncharacterized protein n=1 Tax=Zea mays TaxID=4577 RepID=B7ZZH6_MAIZE|nr:unknown [Zea mays]
MHAWNPSPCSFALGLGAVLSQERCVSVGVAAVEAGVLLEPLVAQHHPGAAHHLAVCQRRRVRRQHDLQRGAERPTRPAAERRVVILRHVRRRLVRLTPAQQDPGVGAGAVVAVAVEDLELELGAGVGAEERQEVVGDVQVVMVRGRHARRRGQVAEHRGVREEPAACAEGEGEARAVGAAGGGPDLLLLLVDEAAAVARVGRHGEGGAPRHAVHQLPEVHVCDEVEVARHDGLVVVAAARPAAAAADGRDERAVAAEVEEEHVPGRRARHHVIQRAPDGCSGREHAAAAAAPVLVVGEHGDVGRREAEAGEEDGAHGVDVVDAALQLVRRAGVVAAHQGGKHLLLLRISPRRRRRRRIHGCCPPLLALLL